MRIASDDDLLTPTLGDEDDVGEYRRPWSPWSLVVLSFVTGLLGAGWLLALNFGRLGMQSRVYALLGVVVVSSLLVAAVYGWIAARGIGGLTGSDAESAAGLLARVLGTGVAATIAARQEKRHRLFSMTGEQGGGLLLPGLAAALCSLLIETGMRHAFVRLF